MKEDWEIRIEAVVGRNSEVCDRNFKRWRTHLLKHLPLPLEVTGAEDFPWEEPYVLGGWDPEEYEELKRDQPSYTDIFELLAIGPADEGEDLNAEVKRLSDGKRFDIGLSWLRPCDEESAAYTALDDYATWQCSY